MRRLNRLHCFVLVTTLLAIVGMSAHFVIGQTSITRFQQQSRGSGRVADLKTQLEFGLRARRSVEFQFIANVVKLVETEKLPVKTVMESFHYARQRRPYPFQYFQRILAIRAAQIGVKIKLV